MKLHRPSAYRYHVADPGVRCGLNRYGFQVIGIYVVIRKYAYCLKWAWAT